MTLTSTHGVDPVNAVHNTAISPDAILQLGSGFFGSRVLLTALGLGLFTELAHGPLTYEALRRRLRLHPRAARDFFDALVALKMIDRHDEQYCNTPAASRYLDRTKDTYIGAWLEMADRRLFRIWSDLPMALATGEPQNEFVGMDPFEAMYADPDEVARFASEMTAVSRPLIAELVRRVDWNRYRTVIDVGTMQGALPVQLATAYPHLTGGGFDLAQVRGVFERYVSEHGLSDRLRFYPGNFRADPLPTADALVMGHVLVDWDDDMKRRLISRAHKALRPGGALLLYDMVIDDERRGNAMPMLMSLNMLLETSGGGQYTAADCAGWLRDAGFGNVTISAMPLSHSLIIATK